jgi:hypothetical protein
MLCEDCEKRNKPFYYCTLYKMQVGKKDEYLKFYGCNIDGEIPK